MRAALLAGLIVIGAAVPAQGEETTIPVPDQPAQLTVDAGWVSGAPRPVADGPSIVLHHPGGALLAVTVDQAPESERANAIGSLSMFTDIATSGGGAVLGLAASLAGYRGAFALAAALAACGLVVVTRGMRTPAAAPADAGTPA